MLSLPLVDEDKMKSLNEKILPITDYRLTKATCARCGAEWFPQVKTRPKKCPYCQCFKWDSYQPPKKSSKQ